MTELRNTSAVVIMMLAALFLSACGPDAKYRYKMIVEVETPEGIKAGHAVREVHYYEGGGFMFGEGRPQVRLTGEAVAIDLPQGRTLFALLTGRDGYEDYADNGISKRRSALALAQGPSDSGTNHRPGPGAGHISRHARSQKH